MFFDIINSGSKGNATVVFTKEATILIDAGIASLIIEEELNKFNKSLKDIDYVLVTHNHTDHIRGIKAFSPKKIYALEGTVPGSLSNVIETNVPFILKDCKVTAFPTSHDALNPCGYVIELNKPFTFKDVEITAFPTSHDAINPCGYLIKDKDTKLVYMTDTGTYLSINTPLIKNPDYLIIESNHDIQMLLHTNRPMELIQRILSEFGHLCNEDSAFATLEIIGDKTKEVILAHLSEEANTPECALSAYTKVFKYAHKDINKYHVRCANQHIPLIGGDYEN